MSDGYDYAQLGDATPIEVPGQVSKANKASRKVGAITSEGAAGREAWTKCVKAQIAHGTCEDGDKIEPPEGCRMSNGYRDAAVSFMVPSTIKAPMSLDGKIKYTAAYDALRRSLSPTKPDDKTALCDKLVPKDGGKRRGKKRGRKTRGKKRVKKTRTKRKHGKKTRRKKHARKTRGKKISKRRGTRKRSYRKRR